jgi:hypothetical protein
MKIHLSETEFLKAELKREQALAPPVQEPVAWFYRDNLGRPCSTTKKPLSPFKDMQPLYTTPPAAQRQWVGLTKEDIVDCLGEPFWDDVIRKAEAKLKEKNT